MRFDILPGNLKLDAGAVYLAKGRFLTDAPNAPDSGDVFYSYFQAEISF